MFVSTNANVPIAASSPNIKVTNFWTSEMSQLGMHKIWLCAIGALAFKLEQLEPMPIAQLMGI